MRIARASKEQLLRWGADYLKEQIDSLEQCHMSPFSKRVEPYEVRLEVARVRRWIARARELAK